ncbi:aminopeptidase N-like [Photinus pyralis]|uniref:aminopeptidase N-like n=1 Tax=Photinus pyralis TaxID=7054 RepID=UPI0012675AE3|nr:aminopeptidase N-like [Photinus pyralis]
MKNTVWNILLLITGVWCYKEYKHERQMERLPTHIIPIRYTITLEPDIGTRKFVGQVQIEVEAKKRTNVITLHSNKLDGFNETNVIVSATNGGSIGTKEVALDAGRQFLVINLKKSLSEGARYLINFASFTGQISATDKTGFYLATYHDNANRIHEFATTQFQTIGARRAFPCFDEPHFKANFTIHLIRPKEYMSLSNEELVSSRKYLQTEKYIDSYRETRRMSSYLVAFVVSKYISTETRQGQRVFADEDSIRNGDGEYALKWGITVLKKLEEFTGIRYTFSKLDQIAIPDKDYAFGAMENWGLVTYKKSSLVYPQQEQTTAGRVRTVSLIAHEYAHQWFGNLVTCSWWSYTWVNEGFAEYFEFFLPTMLNWNMEGLFVMDSVHAALAKDSAKDTVPMNTETAPSIINYQKSSSVIRMLNHVVTEDVFVSALKSYLEEHAYTPVTPTDLYMSFQKTLEEKKLTNLTHGVTIVKMMETWDSQPGYPVLSVFRNYNTGVISLSQKRFFTEDSTGTDQSVWHIPINFVTEVNLNSDSYTSTVATSWFHEKTGELHGMPTKGWILFNKQQTGYYRIMYDEENWRRLTEELINKDHTKIHTYNKAQLIDDSFTFASVGQMKYNATLELTTFLKGEKEYVPIATFLKHAGIMGDRLANSTDRENFKIYLNNILNGTALQVLGMTEKGNEAITAEYLRVMLMEWLCKFGNKHCNSHVTEMFNGASQIPPNLQSVVYCGAVRAGTPAEWIKLYKLYHSTKHALRKSRVLIGLSCTEDKDSLDNSSLPTILNNIATKLHSVEHVDAFTNLAKENPKQADAINSAKKIIQANVDWNTKYGDIVQEWLKSYVDKVNNTENGAVKLGSSLKLLLGTLIVYAVTNIIH